MPLSYLIWMLIIIVCCISFFFMSKEEENKKQLWKKIGVIGFCFGSVLHFVTDLTVDTLLAISRQTDVWNHIRDYGHWYIKGYFLCAVVFVAVAALVYFLQHKIRLALLLTGVLLFGGLLVTDVYMVNYGLATGKSYCGAAVARPAYAELLWCSADRLKQD